jgi:hypothetical protein
MTARVASTKQQHKLGDLLERVQSLELQEGCRAASQYGPQQMDSVRCQQAPWSPSRQLATSAAPSQPLGAPQHAAASVRTPERPALRPERTHSNSSCCSTPCKCRDTSSGSLGDSESPSAAAAAAGATQQHHQQQQLARPQREQQLQQQQQQQACSSCDLQQRRLEEPLLQEDKGRYTISPIKWVLW